MTTTTDKNRADQIERTAASGGAAPRMPLEQKPDSKRNGSGASSPAWEERKAPELFSFDRVGQVVEGILMEAGLTDIKDRDTGRQKAVMQYVIQGTKESVKILGSWDINQKLSHRDLNRLVRIEYTGENQDVKKGDNYLREFAVAVKNQSGEWERRKAPELFSFKGQGDFVEGLLLQAGLTEIKDRDTGRQKRVMQYVIQSETETVKILGSWDINQKISPKDQGSMVRITFVRENKEVKKGENYLREFEVLVAAAPGRRLDDGTHITDEDIPF